MALSIDINFLFHPKMVKAVFISSIIVFVYYILFFWVINDFYQYDLLGALYELLWAAVLALIFVLPVVSLLQLVKVRGTLFYFSVTSFLLSVATIVAIILKTT